VLVVDLDALADAEPVCLVELACRAVPDAAGSAATAALKMSTSAGPRVTA
jgi:hypothetical protein